MAKKNTTGPAKPGTVEHTLSALASGGKLTRERVFPYPPKLVLRWTESGKARDYTLGESLIARLLTDRLIAPDKRAITETPDCIPYFLTDKGTQAAA